MSRRRLDEEVVSRRLLESRSQARAYILAGDVIVNGQTVLRASAAVVDTDVITLAERPRFVSRGGEKLAHGLEIFGVHVEGHVVADLGASTGGFTDCLLQAGARRVYAVDVGYGQISEKLRTDDRVEIMERTNARLLQSLPEPVDGVVVDVSFISLKLILPVAWRLLGPNGWCVPLIKPQFEAGKREVGKQGVVRDPAVHERVVREVIEAAMGIGFEARGVTRSPLKGPAGNVEFLALLRKGQQAELNEVLTDSMRWEAELARALVGEGGDVAGNADSREESL